ncbi:MAG: S-methyl-5'-thioinosine phosphorylase [Solirubrobacterales bacterium]
MTADIKLAVIGGSGLYSLDGLGVDHQASVDTPYGQTSAPLVTGTLGEGRVAFLARHGEGHSIAPHQVNYRANIRALADVGVERILAVCSVGGIGPGCVPGTIVVPDQLIDYTSGREATFSGDGDPVRHPDFTFPYSPAWRMDVVSELNRLRFEHLDGGTYAATQGPRFESSAEVSRLAKDGCTVVGMTGMPEAILARELDIEYAVICPVGNLAAGISAEELSMGEVFDAVGPVLGRIPELVAGLVPG